MKIKLLTLSVLLALAFSTNAQNVGIGTSSPNTSAKLDVSASDKGILFPNVALTSTNDASTIATPATGLIVWNTGSGGLSPAGFYYNAGTSGSPNWTKVANGAVLTNTLTDGRVLIGNASNIATEQAVSGDATISNTGVLDLSDNAVETSEINDLAVTTAKIADNAVTGGKIDISGNANGSLMYYNGTDWVNLAPGTSGQVLRTNGAGAPTWSNGNDIFTFENGLTETSPNIVRLGGALTQPTTISSLTATNKMSFTGTGVDAFNVDGTTFSVDATNDRVGIGTAAPEYTLDVANRMRLRSNGGNTAGVWFNNTNNSALLAFLGIIDDNTLGIYGVGVNDWQFRFDRRSGNVGIGVSPSGTIGENKLIVSRDGLGTFTSNATLSLADNTNVTGRRASIAWHNGGESEGVTQLIQNSINGVTSRRIQFYDNQSQGLGLELSGRLWYGSSGSRTETRDNAGLQGNAGAQSGFYETSSPSANWYPGANSWQHLIDVRHNNPANNYAMQFAGSFFDQRLFFRKTDGLDSRAWSEISTIGRGNGGMISYVKNEYYGVAGANAWNAVTGYSPWMRINNGDQIKLDGMYYGRLTGGSGNDFFYTMVEITGQNGCAAQQFSNQHDYWHTTEAGADHDNFKPVPYKDVWSSNCTGEIRFRLWVYVGGDDNWETRENIITGTRY